MKSLFKIMKKRTFKKVKTSSSVRTIFSREYIRFDERGHKNIRPKPFLKPALEMAMKKIFKKRWGRKKKSNMGNKIDEVERKILKEYPERYYKTGPDRYGNVVITDVFNTEPVCLVYGRYHPYASDLILECLRKYFKRRKAEKKRKKVNKNGERSNKAKL